MPSKIPRPTLSVSVSGPTHARLLAHCQEHGLSMSGVVESLLQDLEGGLMPAPRTQEEIRMATRGATRRAAPVLPPRQPLKLLRDHVPLAVSQATYELVLDSLGDQREGRGKQRDRSGEVSTALEGALVRMLAEYERAAAVATHCAICRVRSKNARPFVPMLAGDGVVAVCSACVKEGRTLEGGVARRVA